MAVTINKHYTDELRHTILENSLLHEYLITKSLGDILEIETESSYSLSDKSSSLSLAAKINLLIDLKGLTKDQKPKLLFYLEIRNQFLHNWKCKSFENCFNSLESTYKALKKLYEPSDSIPVEQQMTYCYNCLSDDIVDIAINHLSHNVIKAKTKRELNARNLQKFEHLRSNLPHLLLEVLESPAISKYKISREDIQRTLIEFIEKVT